jgi:hypothetical protein
MKRFKKYFVTAIRSNYSGNFDSIIAETDNNFKVISPDISFAKTSNNPSKRVNRNDNKGGFKANIITDKQQTYGLGYGIDIVECGICKLFNKHHFDKYAPILCEVDKLTAELAGLILVRTGTIANGAKKCDFRFQKVIEKLS